MEAGKSKNLQGGPVGWAPQKNHAKLKFEGCPLAEFPLAQGSSVFCSIQTFS